MNPERATEAIETLLARIRELEGQIHSKRVRAGDSLVTSLSFLYYQWLETKRELERVRAIVKEHEGA